MQTGSQSCCCCCHAWDCCLLCCRLQVIADYRTPPGKSLTRDLMGAINASVDFLVRCR
jgi:hypothetical protein